MCSLLDQYDKAVEDFTTCLKLREAWLPPDDRRLAEMYVMDGWMDGWTNRRTNRQKDGWMMHGQTYA